MQRPQNTVLVLVGILFTIILAGIDMTIVSTVVPVALPELGGTHLYAWTFAAYMLATAVSMPVWGPGSDRWGRKRTFLLGVVVFVLGSVACAAAPTMPLFIAARALQGIGAGAVLSLPFIVLGVVFPPEKRGKALGVVSSAWAVSSVAGPLLGTLIVAGGSWRWVFLLNLPVGALAALLVARGMEETRAGGAAGRFDLAGSLLAGLGGASLIWGFTGLGEGRVGVAQAALLAAGAALLGAFVWHEGRARDPILPLSFFRHRGYAAAMGASLLAAFTGFGLAAYLPLQADATFGTARAVGLVVAAFTVGWSAFGFTTGRLVHRHGERVFGVAGLVVHALGLLALLVAFDHGLAATALAAALAGAGMGLLTPGLTVVVQNSVEVRRMGSATTSQQFTRQVGGALGVACFVLAARLGGLRAGVVLMALASGAALGFMLALPRTSLPRQAGQGGEGT
ncbi:MAG TPA: MFS transporter [Candidatus Thermoplasmatota archaeon]|nr:MFS transporter [Candidatus Thermoplasmatota archaeon]